ncbi:MAG: dephospho-CoA kinase [Caldilineae bacterium]|nr:dephospho-CoA kinase [Anaerolineae bacterium]MCB0256174.1 dephospho-CoA kinase [Anaerolineae bacterium]MCB9152642.1 dephospho-CoA kinase [Caldilineae bacterium]
MAPHLVIGLTGNIATGKSAVGQMLAELGAEVIDADKVAHQVMEPGQPAYAAIVAAFDDDIAPAGGPIDRRRLGEIVFADPAALARLEALVHPAVGRRIAELVARSTADVVVIEAIKLLEAGLSVRLCDEVWVVIAPRAAQLSRLMESRGLSRDEAVLRIDAQPSQESKSAQADVVIDNDGDLDALRRTVEQTWRAAID